MKNIQLTSVEKKELERRGFYVKENDSIKIFLGGVGVLGVLIAVIFGIGGWLNVSVSMVVQLSIVLIGLFIFYYVQIGAVFYSPNGVLGSGESDPKEISQKNINAFTILDIGTKFADMLRKIINGTFGKEFVFFPILAFVLFGSLGLSFLGDYAIYIMDTLVSSTSNTSGLSHSIPFSIVFGLFSLLIILGLVSIMYYMLKSIYQSINPLYVFSNLGHKIQSLTPRITEQSKKIESGFRGDMDFRVLSKSFDSLASTFSDIVALVIKLEKVEQKANKGDLFDSTKYINSLREDIRTPLLSLKNFLESKKVELESSQQELMRVRVSVGGEGENRKLQSIRSQELIKELDENIGKLDVMLERL